MKLKMKRFFFAILLALSVATQAEGQVLATSGFNDASGVNSNTDPNSPFQIGISLNNQGVGEPGWARPWNQIGGSSDRVPVQTDLVFEGDAAIRLFADRVFGTSMERRWSEIVPRVRVDQYVLVSPSASIAGHVMGSASGEILSRAAVRWQIESNGNILVRDGGVTRSTGFSTLPNEWNKYSVIVDTDSQTWEFLFNDQRFETAQPLSFLNPTNVVDRVNLQARATRDSYIDLVTVTAIPGPDNLVTLVPTGSDWSYLDDGTNQAAAWRDPAFDDSAWPSGPAQLGYGDNDEATVVSFGGDASNKFTTTYFRNTFTVDDASLVEELSGLLLRDDAGAVYLNGVEVFRDDNLPSTATFDTLATAVGVENGTVSFSIEPALLVDGENVLAVEIHQATRGSSDISFDLRLTGVVNPIPEPGTLSLLAIGWGTLLCRRRRAMS